MTFLFFYFKKKKKIDSISFVFLSWLVSIFDYFLHENKHYIQSQAQPIRIEYWLWKKKREHLFLLYPLLLYTIATMPANLQTYIT